MDVSLVSQPPQKKLRNRNRKLVSGRGEKKQTLDREGERERARCEEEAMKLMVSIFGNVAKGEKRQRFV